jgi:hypothetical protein
MAIGGIIEILFGVNAEGKSLEDITKPLTAVTTDDAKPLKAPPVAGAPA